MGVLCYQLKLSFICNKKNFKQTKKKKKKLSVAYCYVSIILSKERYS